MTTLLVMAFLVALPAWAAERSGFKVKRGTSISHWLSQSQSGVAFQPYRVSRGSPGIGTW